MQHSPCACSAADAPQEWLCSSCTVQAQGQGRGDADTAVADAPHPPQGASLPALARALVACGWWVGLTPAGVTARILTCPELETRVPRALPCMQAPRAQLSVIPQSQRGSICLRPLRRFGINTTIGGNSIFKVAQVISGGALTAPRLEWLGLSLPELACFGVFWVIQVRAGAPGVLDEPCDTPSLPQSPTH